MIDSPETGRNRSDQPHLCCPESPKNRIRNSRFLVKFSRATLARREFKIDSSTINNPLNSGGFNRKLATVCELGNPSCFKTSTALLVGASTSGFPLRPRANSFKVDVFPEPATPHSNGKRSLLRQKNPLNN